MKKFIFKTAMIVAVCLCWYGNRMNRTPKMDNLLLMNVEALSLDEYWDYWRCDNDGDIKCPEGGTTVLIYLGDSPYVSLY